MAYGVVRTDLLAGTDLRDQVVSVKYMGAGSTATAIENGNVCLLSGMAAIDQSTNERQIFKGVTPSANSSLDDIVLIASPEVMYDERKKDLDEFRNEAGDIARGFRLHHGGIFSVTGDALQGDCDVDSIIELQAGAKMKAVSSLTSGSTQVGTCIAKETAGKYTFYVIQIV